MALRKSFSLLNIRSLLRCQSAGIQSKDKMDVYGPRPPPYPYERDHYLAINTLFDKTTWRFDENTKIIVVDGPFGAGKAEFAKGIADRLDMQYIPPAHLDSLYMREDGLNYRHYLENLSEEGNIYGLEDFLQHPNQKKGIRLLYDLMLVRFSDYWNGLHHLLSTGQGLVFNRSLFSDFVIMETFTKFGFVSKAFKKYYYDIKYLMVPNLLRPNLVIYLDVPVNVVLQRIHQRNRPWEKNSPFYKPEILQYMETIYKQRYLKHITGHAELLAYDWTEKGILDDVVDDIEEVNLDDYDIMDKKMEDWRMGTDSAWCKYRQKISCQKYQHIAEIRNHHPYDCPDVFLDQPKVIKMTQNFDRQPNTMTWNFFANPLSPQHGTMPTLKKNF